MNSCSPAPAPKKATGGDAKKGAKAMMELEDDDEEDDSEDEEDDSEDDDDEEDSDEEDDDDYEGKKSFATTGLYIGPNCAALKRLLVDSMCPSSCWISSSIMCFAALRHSWFESTVLLEWAFYV